MPCSFVSSSGASTLPPGRNCQSFDPAGESCKVYRPTHPAARVAIVGLGAAIPIAFVVVSSGVLTRWNTVMQTAGYTLYGVVAFVLLLWIAIIVKGSAHPDRTTTEYIEAGLGTFSYLIVGAGGLVSLITKLM